MLGLAVWRHKHSTNTVHKLRQLFNSQTCILWPWYYQGYEFGTKRVTELDFVDKTDLESTGRDA